MRVMIVREEVDIELIFQGEVIKVIIDFHKEIYNKFICHGHVTFDTQGAILEYKLQRDYNDFCIEADVLGINYNQFESIKVIDQ